MKSPHGLGSRQTTYCTVILGVPSTSTVYHTRVRVLLSVLLLRTPSSTCTLLSTSNSTIPPGLPSGARLPGPAAFVSVTFLG
jgi:hypothetical protein